MVLPVPFLLAPSFTIFTPAREEREATRTYLGELLSIGQVVHRNGQEHIQQSICEQLRMHKAYVKDTGVYSHQGRVAPTAPHQLSQEQPKGQTSHPSHIYSPQCISRELLLCVWDIQGCHTCDGTPSIGRRGRSGAWGGGAPREGDEMGLSPLKAQQAGGYSFQTK